MYGFKHERIDKNDNFIYYLEKLEFRYNFRDNIEDSLYKYFGGIIRNYLHKNGFISFIKSSFR
jgi:hypothetical protein